MVPYCFLSCCTSLSYECVHCVVLQILKTLTFYKNGFTVDDGPLREFKDPQNKAFLSNINKGYVLFSFLFKG